MTDDGAVPPYDALPRLPGNGVRHAWDVWGRGDNLGTLNRLTGPVAAAAAGCVRTGTRTGLSLPLGLPDPPFFGRKGFRHTFEPMGPAAWDDRVDGFYLSDGFLYGRLITGLGMAIGELFSFGALAAACGRQRRYEFLFASVPLNVTGAIGSPANAVAIL